MLRVCVICVNTHGKCVLIRVEIRDALVAIFVIVVVVTRDVISMVCACGVSVFVVQKNK